MSNEAQGSLRKAYFEKAQSKGKQKFKSKELVLQYFCGVSKVHIGKGTWWLPTHLQIFLAFQ